MTLTPEPACRDRPDVARSPGPVARRLWAGAVLMLLVGCTGRHEVSRVSSPDGALDAVLLESSSGAAPSADYSIYVVKHGAPLGRSPAVMYVHATPRGDASDAVAPRWADDNSLAVDYQVAGTVTVPRREIRLENRSVRITPRPGALDPPATAGGVR